MLAVRFEARGLREGPAPVGEHEQRTKTDEVEAPPSEGDVFDPRKQQRRQARAAGLDRAERPDQSSGKYGHHPNLSRFRRSLDRGRCRDLPRLSDRKCLLLNGFGMSLKEIVIKSAVALCSSIESEKSYLRLVRLRGLRNEFS